MPKKLSPLPEDLLRFRAVLVLLAAPHGSKGAATRTIVEELEGRLTLSVRSLSRWKANYLRSGFAGIPRRRRNDHGRPHFNAATLARIVDASRRVRRHGDIAREFRGGFVGLMTPETFRFWVRHAQRQRRVVTLPLSKREEPHVSPL